MRLLTTSGYKNVIDCIIGEQLVAYDIMDGHIITNELLGKKWFSPDMFEDYYETDENGDSVLVKTKEEIFTETYGPLDFYLINGTWELYENQSIWSNMRVCHAKDLSIGDIIYTDNDQDVIINTIEKKTGIGWWRMTVSGDHSYIADNLTLHNASRYWVGGGASVNWNATGNTNWGSVSGTKDNASVPTSADDVTFDGVGTTGNSNSTISATITILSLNITTGYTATMTHNGSLTIAGNWSFSNTYTLLGTLGITLSASSTITSNGKFWPNPLSLSGTNAIYTLNGNLTIGGSLISLSNSTINKTTNETITCNNGINVGNAAINGNAEIIFKGGTWYGNSSSTIILNNNLTIDGNITVSGQVSYGVGILKYISGNITTTGSTLNIYSSCSIDSNNLLWNNVTSLGSTKTITLLSNLNINGLLSVTSFTTTINKTTNEVVNCYGGINAQNIISGTSEINLFGGSLTSFTGQDTIQININILGNIILNSNPVRCSNCTIKYLSGKITENGNYFRISTNVNFLGFHKTLLSNLIVTGGQTIYFDQLPKGSSSNILTITATNTTNYTINFLDNFEKIGRNVVLNNCTLQRPMQLLVINNPRFNTNRNTNSLGIRYINQSPNGFSENLLPSSDRSLFGTFGSLVSDPCFQKQG